MDRKYRSYYDCYLTYHFDDGSDSVIKVYIRCDSISTFLNDLLEPKQSLEILGIVSLSASALPRYIYKNLSYE